MSITKEEALKKISDLVERFEEQLPSYKKQEYNETQVRRDFIDPFFKALGWDIDNSQGHAEAYREVIHEDRVKIGRATKAPDYSFKLSGGKRLFFVEAKKPSVAVKSDILPAYQVRRYGWSAKLPISIITDFEEFAIYDCTKRPKPDDKASVARIKYVTFREYIQEFDFLWDTFSKERILKGGYDKFIKSDNNKKGTASVDKEFLASLDNWRTYLATSIAIKNKQLLEEEINFVVQQTIDRIIFLRIAEDRGVEIYGNLKNVTKSGDYYANLFEQFKVADAKYNSGLFDFKKDNLSKDLVVDNKVIKNIMTELYYPDSPYEFSVLPVEILGSAYEQFLGKVIRITPAHHAKIEEKPEVRKAGGVYYTPQYIVDYIVENTVGKLCEGKSPKEVAELKICDPACGSGSFLLGAYQYLLDWHKNYYNENLKGQKLTKDSPIRQDGYLTANEKKKILLNNIYGVDIDANAVEVTKLSLLIKCMEGETEASISAQLSLFNERILPTLDGNIQCGNSLIDMDYFDGQIDFGEDPKVKPFSWEKGFPGVFNRKILREDLGVKELAKKAKAHATKALEYVSLIDEKLIIANEPESVYGYTGGFDVIIGNPPYGAELSKDNQTYCLNKYGIGNTDTAALFVIQAKRLLHKQGIFGYIIPKAFTYASNWAKTRNKVLFDLQTIIDCGKVWKEVKLEMTVLIAQNNFDSLSFNSLVNTPSGFVNKGRINKSLCLDFDFIINGVGEQEMNIANKIRQHSTNFNAIVTNQRGAMLQKELSDTGKLKAIGGKQVQRYSKYDDCKGKLNKNQVADDKAYIKNNAILVQNIVAHVMNPEPHIVISATLGSEFEKDIVIIDTVNQLNNNSIYDSKLILAILNSKLIAWYTYKFIYANAIRTMHFDSPVTEKLPFPKLDIKDKTTVASLNEIVKLVDQLLQLNKDLQVAKLQTKMDEIRQKIEWCEEKIDSLVYGLYGVMGEEIEVIEGNS